MFRSALLLLFLACTASFAGQGQPVGSVLHLTLDEAIRMALAKNYDIEVTRFEPKIAQENVRSELGIFDPSLTSELTRDRNETGTIFLNDRRISRGGRSLRDQSGMGLGGLTPWGTEYGFDLLTRRNVSSDFGFRDEYSTEASFSLNQPLLRGAGTASTLRGIRIARNNAMASEWLLRQQIIETVTETVRVYNELQLAQENLQVQIRSRGLAEQLLRDNTKRAEIGVMSPLNITTARAEAAAREEDVIVAQRRVKDNENFLKQLVTADLISLLSVQVEIATPPSPAFAANVRAGVRDALALRPDYRRAVLDLERRHITLAFQKNNSLPQLDLQGSLKLLGFYDDALGSVARVAKGEEVGWTAGAIFSVPLGNRSREGAENAARLTAAQGLVELQRLEQQIVVEVDNASGAVVTARERIVSTAESRTLAAESLEAGEGRLRADTGTTFEVLELQNRLSDAELALLRARADYNIAVSNYYRSIGTTLGVYRIEVGRGS